jgi:hypothetical protein
MCRSRSIQNIIIVTHKGYTYATQGANVFANPDFVVPENSAIKRGTGHHTGPSSLKAPPCQERSFYGYCTP